MHTREKIYNGLKQHKGAMVELRKRTGKSERWITQVMKGTWADTDLLLEAAKLWKELEENRQQKLDDAGRIADEAEKLAKGERGCAA